MDNWKGNSKNGGSKCAPATNNDQLGENASGETQRYDNSNGKNKKAAPGKKQ